MGGDLPRAVGARPTSGGSRIYDRLPELATPWCSPGDPPLQKGEVVYFAEGKSGTITRAYGMENKYAVKPLGEVMEVRGGDGQFRYFRKHELQRAVPLRAAQD